MSDEKFDVNKPEDLEPVLKDRIEKARKHQMNEAVMGNDPKVNHLEVANQVLKAIQMMSVDQRIKDVMTVRILGPIKAGREISHYEIALKFKMSEAEVKEIEIAGQEILTGYLQKVSSPEFMAKFNRENKAFKDIVKGF